MKKSWVVLKDAILSRVAQLYMATDAQQDLGNSLCHGSTTQISFILAPGCQ